MAHCISARVSKDLKFPFFFIPTVCISARVPYVHLLFYSAALDSIASSCIQVPSSSIIIFHNFENMGGSKTSSIGNSSGLSLPICGCNEPMKMRVSNTNENHNRKFWKYRNWGISFCSWFSSFFYLHHLLLTLIFVVNLNA